MHTRVDHDIQALGNHNLRSEASYLKADEEAKESKENEVYRGMKGTIRVDVDEKAENNTACVYDIKTGRSGLSEARVAEIVTRVYARGKPDRLIITEVRPQQ